MAKSAKSKLVAVVPVYGVISQRASMFDDISGGASVEQIAKQLRLAMANPEVKAIVMDFDTPGGSVYGIDELAQEIFDARQQKEGRRAGEPFVRQRGVLPGVASERDRDAGHGRGRARSASA
jgi:ClpP class serine protease